MKNRQILQYLFLLLILLLSTQIFGNDTKAANAPWDTLVANMQIIESMKKPDSVKTAMTKKLFSDYQIEAEDYNNFYDDFLKKSPEQQAKFFKKVEEIILELMNRIYRQDE